MQATVASPFTTSRSWGTAPKGLPSISTQSGCRPVSATAPATASRSARAMPISSMRSGGMWQMPTARAHSAMRTARISRLAGESCLESLIPHKRGSSGRHTAHTVRGPATDPLPTSSTPTTTPSPPNSRMASYMPSTRSRSALSLSMRRRARSQAFWTCMRGSSAYRAMSASISSKEALASSAATWAAEAELVILAIRDSPSSSGALRARRPKRRLKEKRAALASGPPSVRICEPRGRA